MLSEAKMKEENLCHRGSSCASLCCEGSRCERGSGLKNAIDIQWNCTKTRLVVVSPSLPAKMQRPEARWCIESFELAEALYKGKASLVYVAFDKVSSLVVVLKLYRKSKLSILNRFQVEREILLHTELSHGHIIDMYAAFEDAKYVYLVQEYAEKGDLFGEIKEKPVKKMCEEDAVRHIVYPFLSSLQHLHSKGIIHRDIKPENIFMTRDGTIKLADFGLSIDETKERPVTRAGTLDYMAPEVLNCPNKTYPEENKTNRSIVYDSRVHMSVSHDGPNKGEHLLGSPPFENESRSATYDAIMHDDPIFPQEMSTDCREFIKQALAKNIRLRPSIDTLLAHPWITKYMGSDEPCPKGETTEAEASSSHALPEVESGTEAETATDKTKEEDLEENKIKEESQEPRIRSPPPKQILPPLICTPKPNPITPEKKSALRSSREQTHPAKSPLSSSPVGSAMVGRTPSFPSLRFATDVDGASPKDDLQLRSSQQSLSLVHQVFSKSEEEKHDADALLESLNRLPSYSFFPTNRQDIFHPAHRLNRELTGSQNSFTERVSTSPKEKSQTRPTVRFTLNEESNNQTKEPTVRRRISFLRFRKKE